MQTLIAVAVKLETLCDLLASYMAKWQDKRLPKLLRKDILRWHSRETHLPVWLEEDSHIKVRLNYQSQITLTEQAAPAASSERSLVALISTFLTRGDWIPSMQVPLRQYPRIEFS